MGDNKRARDAVNMLRAANGKAPLDDLEEEVNRSTKGSAPPKRVNPLREYDTLGPSWQGGMRAGRNVDEFRRDKGIAAAAEAADKEDVPHYAKGGLVKGVPHHHNKGHVVLHSSAKQTKRG